MARSYVYKMSTIADSLEFREEARKLRAADIVTDEQKKDSQRLLKLFSDVKDDEFLKLVADHKKVLESLKYVEPAVIKYDLTKVKIVEFEHSKALQEMMKMINKSLEVRDEDRLYFPVDSLEFKTN